MSSGVARTAWITGVGAALALAGHGLAALAQGTPAPAAVPAPIANDNVAATLATWDRLRRDEEPASFAELSAFLRAHPGWPLETQLRRKAERLIDPLTPLPDRLTYFAAFPPLTATAKFRDAEALMATGRRAEAARLIKQAWVSDGLSAGVEGELLGKYGSLLTPADHYARTDRLIWSGQTGSAARMAPLIPPERRAILEARFALRADAPDAAAKLAALTPADRADPGVIADQTGRLRRAFQTVAARQLLADAAIAPGTVVDPVKWMQLRREVARQAAADAQYDLAYRIAGNHRTFPLGRPMTAYSDAERDVYTDLEFLAGWIALKNLDRPADAVAHFENYRGAAKSMLTQARGDYWAGRAAETAGQATRARGFYESAARHPDYFFGQLATERLGRPLILPPATTVVVSAPARAAFRGSELVRAATLLGTMDDRARQTIFLKQLVTNAQGLEQQRLVADLAPALGRPDLGVLVAREARNDGELALLDASYPRLRFGDLSASPSLVHAVSRQESRFDRTAVSPAGARGLMQLMPATAREQAGKMGLPYDAERLFDEQYNAALGSAYFQRLVGRWNGNVMLAVASYNAGAGNVNKWIAANGDPRDPNVDVIDWIERIPISETRIYVWRVLENAVMYDLLDTAAPRAPVRDRLAAYLGKRTAAS